MKVKVWNEITFKAKPTPQGPVKFPQNEEPSACTGNVKSKPQHSQNFCFVKPQIFMTESFLLTTAE